MDIWRNYEQCAATFYRAISRQRALRKLQPAEEGVVRKPPFPIDGAAIVSGKIVGYGRVNYRRVYAHEEQPAALVHGSVGMHLAVFDLDVRINSQYAACGLLGEIALDLAIRDSCSASPDVNCPGASCHVPRYYALR